MPRTFLKSDCIVLIIFMIQCCIIICVIFCIGRYILVEIKLQCSCIAIKLLSYCTSYMYYLDTRVKEVKSYCYCYVFILSAISPYTTGLKALFNQSDCTGTAPTLK